MRRRTRSNPGPTVRAAPESRTFVSSFEADTKTKATRLKSEVPGEWLAALLSLACELPIEDGAEAVPNALVGTIGRILPGHAFRLSLSAPFEADKSGGGPLLPTPPAGSPGAPTPD